MDLASSPGSSCRHVCGQELSLALEQLVRLVRELSSTGDLSFAAASMLNRLLRTGPQRLTELARAEGASQPGMTQLVTRLEREGLVTRSSNARDRRGVTVMITAHGAAMIDRRRARRGRALDDLLTRLGPDDQAAIAAALPAFDRLVRAAAELADDPAPPDHVGHAPSDTRSTDQQATHLPRTRTP